MIPYDLNDDGVVGEDDSADWDKIVIMGQQIASDDELFAVPSDAISATIVSKHAIEARHDNDPSCP